MTLITGAPTAESPTAETETVIEGAAPAATEVTTAAASSTADETDAKPADLLSVVKDAVTKPDAETGSSTVAGEGEAQPGAEAEPKPDEGEGTAEAQADADAKLPFHEHPRWKEVVAERNSFREDATSFREVRGFMQEHGLTPQEVGEGFDIMAKLKAGTPEKLEEAREYFASRLAFLDGALGNTLPDDLRDRVDSGELSNEAAQELARLQAADKLRTARDEERETETAAERDRNARLATATAMATAVDDWEKQQQGADPDYAHKADLIEAQCLAIVNRDPAKKPGNAEQAVALAKQAYAEVSAKFKNAIPKPKAISRDPVGSSAPAVAEPKNLREAIAAAASKGR